MVWQNIARKKNALLPKSINQNRKSTNHSLIRETKRHPFDILTGSSCRSVEVYVCIFSQLHKTLTIFVGKPPVAKTVLKWSKAPTSLLFVLKHSSLAEYCFLKRGLQIEVICFAWTEDRALHLKKKFGHVALNIYLFTRSIGWYWEIFQQIYMTSWTNFYWYPLIHILEVNNWLQLGRVSVSLNKQ